MSEHLKANEEGATYFVTLTTVGWMEVFTRKEHVEILFNNLDYCRAGKGLEIFEYVVMPSHVHLILRRKEGLLADLPHDFKSFTAKGLPEAIGKHPSESRREWMMEMFERAGAASAQNSRCMFRQKTSHPEELTSQAFYDQKADYIRNNPVEAGLVTDPEHHAWSSAHPDPMLRTDEE